MPALSELRLWGIRRLERWKHPENTTPLLDASLLLADAVGCRREDIHLHPDRIVPVRAAFRYRCRIFRRMRGEPVAYLLGRKEFYGRDFYVKRGVLIPRSDSETLIERALQLIDRHPDSIKTAHDLCAGSGCLAITLKKEREKLHVSASDISRRAERCFRKNLLSACGSENAIRFYRCNLFDKLPGGYDMIVSNPPYLTSDEYRERRKLGWREPKIALESGGNGLACIEKIVHAAPRHLNGGGRFLMEAAPEQMDAIANLLKKNGFSDIQVHNDLTGNGRIIEALLALNAF